MATTKTLINEASTRIKHLQNFLSIVQGLQDYHGVIDLPIDFKDGTAQDNDSALIPNGHLYRFDGKAIASQSLTSWRDTSTRQNKI